MFQEPMLLIALHSVEEATRKQFGEEYIQASEPQPLRPTFNLWAWLKPKPQPRGHASVPRRLG